MPAAEPAQEEENNSPTRPPLKPRASADGAGPSQPASSLPVRRPPHALHLLPPYPRLALSSPENSSYDPISTNPHLPPQAEAVRRIEINRSIAVARKLQTQVEATVRAARASGTRVPLGDLLLEVRFHPSHPPPLLLDF